MEWAIDTWTLHPSLATGHLIVHKYFMSNKIGILCWVKLTSFLNRYLSITRNCLLNHLNYFNLCNWSRELLISEFLCWKWSVYILDQRLSMTCSFMTGIMKAIFCLVFLFLDNLCFYQGNMVYDFNFLFIYIYHWNNSFCSKNYHRFPWPMVFISAG